MSPGTSARFLLAVLLASLPAGALWLLAADVDPIQTAAFHPKAENYLHAVERLEAASQTLVTVTLATLGAAGLLLLRARTLLLGAAGFSVFLCSVFSIYCATKLGYFAALTLAADAGDIRRLGPLLDNQAAAALVAGIALAVMLCFASVPATDQDLQG